MTTHEWWQILGDDKRVAYIGRAQRRGVWWSVVECPDSFARWNLGRRLQLEGYHPEQRSETSLWLSPDDDLALPEPAPSVSGARQRWRLTDWLVGRR